MTFRTLKQLFFKNWNLSGEAALTNVYCKVQRNKIDNYCSCFFFCWPVLFGSYFSETRMGESLETFSALKKCINRSANFIVKKELYGGIFVPKLMREGGAPK